MRERQHAFLLVINADKPEEFYTAVMHGFLRHVRMMDEQSFCKLVANRKHRAQCAQGILEYHGNTFAADLRHLLVSPADQLFPVKRYGPADAGIFI